MPEIGEQNPLNPLYPITPAKRPEKKPGRSPDLPRREKIADPSASPDEQNDNGKPHIDEYA